MNANHCLTLLLLMLLATVSTRAASLAIDSLSGPVTQNEINTFLTFMQAQTPPQTPWGVYNGTTGDHNEWADGTGGREMEAMGDMYEVSSNITLLNLMISWADDCVSQRNDLMATNLGGHRIMWTGLVDEVWCPNEPSSADAGYAGCENEDTEGHLAFCAKLILQNPVLWNVTVPDGNPYGYGTTYLQRATNYLGKCDQANDEYTLKWFIQSGTDLIQAPTNAAWIAEDENVNAINRQMMFTSGFQRLAEAHELLGDNSSRVTQYDAIVQAMVGQCVSGMTNFDTYKKNGQTVYDWGYYPTTDAPEATEIHAEYDIIGLYRAFNRLKYGFTLAPLVPLANTMVDVIYLGTNTFAGDVAGGSGTQSPIYSGWIWSADWNPLVYTTVAGSAYTNGWYETSADIDAGILWMKNRRYLEFSVTPSPASQIVQAGTGASFAVALAPLGGFTNVINLALTSLPAGMTGTLTPTSVNTATLNVVSTNLTLAISTSNSTPAGTYTLGVIGTSGGVSHTNFISVIVGTYALSAGPPTDTVSAGNSASFTVSLTTNTSFVGPVTFGASGLPAGASASFSPGSLNAAGNSTATITTATTTPAGTYTLTIFGTNGTTVFIASASLMIVGATPVWTGGGGDNNWSDAANWGDISLTSGDSLIFNGTTRLSNTNDTAALASYSNLVFSASAGAFVLNGNPLTLTGNITNNSSTPQTLDLGLQFNGNYIFNGASGPLVFGGGLTNTAGASGSSTLTLVGTGVLTNLFNSTTSPGGTNTLLMSSSTARWTLLNNSSSTATTVPWVFNILEGTFTFGSAGSAPTLTSTTVNGAPQDNLVGNLTGGTGTFNMVNGSLATDARLDTAVVDDSTGILNQSGGTLTIGSQFQGANGQNPDEVSLVTLTGGTMNIGTAGNPDDPFYVASRDTGTLTVSNSAVLNCGTLDVSRNAYGNTIGSIGVVNLDGGTILCTKVSTATANAQTSVLNSTTATFNFNGGTLKINSSTAPFFQGSTVAPLIPLTAVVKLGGAFIDSNRETNTFAEPLLHDATLGDSPDGGLTKNGSGCLMLVSNVSYTGNTTVNAGDLALSNAVALSTSPLLTIAAGALLDASGRSDGTLSLVAGQTLTGSGSVKGNVMASPGATVTPGASVGTLSFQNNLALSNGSTTVMAINKSLTPSNSVAQVTGSVSVGGTLIVTNLGTIPLAAGDNFKLFSAASYSGGFTNIKPILPGLNLAWNTNGLATGVLAVASSPTLPPNFGGFKLAGNNLIFSGSNGVPGWPCVVLTTTNLALPLSDWTRLATNAFNASGGFSFTNSVNATAPQNFYQLELN
jgi:autotransporter-associated beta strand protein